MLELGAHCDAALGQPCSAVMYSMGMGQATLFASPRHRPATSSLPVLCRCPSQLAVAGPCPMFPQPVQALGHGQLTHAGGEKCAPLLRVKRTGCAVFAPRAAGLFQGSAEPLCPASTAHEASRRNTSAPLASSLGLQPLSASGHCCGRPAVPRPRVAFGGSLTERMSLVGGSSRTR